MKTDKRVVVITGATSGMGEAMVYRFVSKGDHVVMAGFDEKEGNEVLQKAKGMATENEVHFVTCDVSVEDQVNELGDFVERQFGRCDVLCANAGIFRGGPIHETTTEDWDILFAVNVKGVFFISRRLIPLMLQQKKGAIVITSSVSGIAGDYNMAGYCACKGALSNLTRAMALDYADQGIRVNAICPGATRTPMFMNGSTPEVIDLFNKAFPPRRIGEPEEIAKSVYFLASDEASYLIGLNLAHDGGLSAWTGQPRQEKEEG
jgi:meso-butanediol dehydrogenase / (S,S)-butanediol dehydrogenase / diacetyl reductase